jgi:hypothetical protein
MMPVKWICSGKKHFFMDVSRNPEGFALDFYEPTGV